MPPPAAAGFELENRPYTPSFGQMSINFAAEGNRTSVSKRIAGIRHTVKTVQVVENNFLSRGRTYGEGSEGEPVDLSLDVFFMSALAFACRTQ